MSIFSNNDSCFMEGVSLKHLELKAKWSFGFIGLRRNVKLKDNIPQGDQKVGLKSYYKCNSIINEKQVFNIV